MRLKPGETSPKTCTCCMCDSKGKVINKVDIKKGQTLPPTPRDDCYYEIGMDKKLQK